MLPRTPVGPVGGYNTDWLTKSESERFPFGAGAEIELLEKVALEGGCGVVIEYLVGWFG